MGSSKMTSITNFKNLNTDYLLAISGMFACFGWEVEDPFTLDLTDFNPTRAGVEKEIVGVFANAGAYSRNFQITGLSTTFAEYFNVPNTEKKYYYNVDDRYEISELSLIENFSGAAALSTSSVLDLSDLTISLTTAGQIRIGALINEVSSGSTYGSTS